MNVRNSRNNVRNFKNTNLASAKFKVYMHIDV